MNCQQQISSSSCLLDSLLFD